MIKKNNSFFANLEFQGQKIFLSAFYSTHHEGEEIISRSLIVLSRNGLKVSSSFNTANACVLTATLWFWTRRRNVYISNNVNSQFCHSIN